MRQTSCATIMNSVAMDFDRNNSVVIPTSTVCLLEKTRGVIIIEIYSE